MFELGKFLRQIVARALQSDRAPTLLGATAGRGALDGAGQQGIEGGADEEFKSLDGGERGEGSAGPQAGIFHDLVETLVNALDRLLVRTLGIDDFLEIAR